MDANMSKFVLSDWQSKVLYSPSGIQPQALHADAHFHVLLGGLQPGRRIPVHPELGAVYYILQGAGWMTVDAERFPIQAGAIIGMGDGAARGIEAETQLAFLAVRAGAD